MALKAAILLAILASYARADLSALVPYTVPVETAKPITLSVMSGEDVTWQFAFTEGGSAKDLSSAESVAMTYTRTGVTYQVSGSIYSATGGQARVSWTSTNATPAGAYEWVCAVSTGSVALCRARGTLTVAPGVSAVGGSPPTWLQSTMIGAYSNHVRQTYLRGVEVSPGVWTIYQGD